MRKAIDATPPWARTPVCNGPTLDSFIAKVICFCSSSRTLDKDGQSVWKSSLLSLWLDCCDATPLRSAETSMFTSFWESMPIAARLHPPHPPPSVFAQTLRKVEATDCRRSRRRIKPCVDLRHSLFPFRSRILQGHILGESLSCVTCYQEFPNVQQDPLYRSLELTDSPFEDRWYRCWGKRPFALPTCARIPSGSNGRTLRRPANRQPRQEGMERMISEMICKMK